MKAGVTCWTGRRGASGVTLVEVVVAAAVLAGLILPLLNLFSSTTRRVGTEVVYVRAAGLADELLTQIEHVHVRLGRLDAVPSRDHVGGHAAGGELDLETYLRTFPGEDNVVLLPGRPEDARGSRLHLTPTQRGFRRFLKIAAARSAPVRRNEFSDTLWLATARVEYDVVLDGKSLTREVVLRSYYFQRCGPDEKFLPPR